LSEQIGIIIMSKHIFKTIIFCCLAALSHSTSLNAQTMTLIDASAPAVNNVLNVGTSGTSGYVSGALFTANFIGYKADIGFTGASGVISGANPSWSVSGIGASASATTVSGVATTSNYIAAASGAVTFSFSKSISQFQFLWGSPDFADTVTLYSAGKQVAQFTGAQVNAANPAFTNASKTTVIANLQTSSGVTFDSLVMSSPKSTFEFSLQTSKATAPTVAGGAIVVPSLPAPAPFPMLGATLFGNMAAIIGMFAMWRKKYKLKTVLAQV
jgi:hypothetical protein